MSAMDIIPSEMDASDSPPSEAALQMHQTRLNNAILCWAKMFLIMCALIVFHCNILMLIVT